MRSAACLAVFLTAVARLTAVAQAPFNPPGSGYPPPSGDVAPFDAPTPAYGGMPLGVPFGFPTTDPSAGAGAPMPGPGDPSADPSGGATAGEEQTDAVPPIRVLLSPALLELAEGGRAVAVTLEPSDAPVQRASLDLRFDADRVAVTAITPDPLLGMSGAQVDFKHRLEPGRLRLSVSLTVTDPSQLPAGASNVASIMFAALTAGSAELTLNPVASSVTTADGTVRDVVLDAPVNIIVNDGPSDAMAAEVVAQSDSLVAASAPASEMGGGGGGTGVAGMAQDAVNRLLAELGALGGSDNIPLLAWLTVIVGAVLVTGLGYVLGRAPEPAGPRVARGLRGRRRGGVDIEHEVLEEVRERR